MSLSGDADFSSAGASPWLRGPTSPVDPERAKGLTTAVVWQVSEAGLGTPPSAGAQRPSQRSAQRLAQQAVAPKAASPVS